MRYLDAIDEHEIGGRAYVVSVLENHSRAILASAVTLTQDLSAFLSVLYRAVEWCGSPEALTIDSGSIFLANQAKAVYEAAGVAKHEIERGKPWQSYIETALSLFTKPSTGPLDQVFISHASTASKSFFEPAARTPRPPSATRPAPCP